MYPVGTSFLPRVGFTAAVVEERVDDVHLWARNQDRANVLNNASIDAPSHSLQQYGILLIVLLFFKLWVFAKSDIFPFDIIEV